MKCYLCKATKNKDGTPIKSWRCKECHTRNEKRKYHKDPKKYREAKMNWKKKNPLRQKEIDRRARRKLKLDALNAYSNNNPKCVCCGEQELEFLCLDHTNNDGNKHRKITGRGNTFYFWLRKNKYPKLNIQILCFNCNNSKKITGICIHKRKTMER